MIKYICIYTTAPPQAGRTQPKVCSKGEVVSKASGVLRGQRSIACISIYIYVNISLKVIKYICIYATAPPQASRTQPIDCTDSEVVSEVSGVLRGKSRIASTSIYMCTHIAAGNQIYMYHYIHNGAAADRQDTT